MTNARDLSPVRIRREELGMLLVQLAAKVKRSAALVSMIEGGYVPKRTTMAAFAAALDTTPQKLWPGEHVGDGPDG